MSPSKILFVSATKLEIAPVLEKLDLIDNSKKYTSPAWLRGNANIDALITGVGQMFTAYHLGRVLERENYALAINLGIAGSFKQEYPKCSIVNVVQEELADLGAENGDEFLDLFEMNLLGRNTAPFTDGTLQAPSVELPQLKSLPHVKSVTVNRVLGTERSIEYVKQRYSPDIVSMEGAAFFYCCLQAGIPFIELRAISDMVGPRDKGRWDIEGAVRVLNETGYELISVLSSGPKSTS